MYGAILGDIIGSPFEFDRGKKTKDFDLFSRGCSYTDDSVMTVAIAEALIAVGPDASIVEIKEAVVANMQDWGQRYPNAGYGGSFRHWLTDSNPKPYGSYGNGSAMRVSAVGWLYPSIERTKEVAKATASVTHNHKEGIKGAESTACAIFMARNGTTKEEIKSYVEREYHYDLNRSLDEIRPTYHHVESCQETVPQAIIAFLEAESYEDAIRNAVSLGGDTDTLAVITGGIAEAFFGMPAILRAECRDRLPGDMLQVVELFDNILDRTDGRDTKNEDLAGNEAFEIALEQLYRKNDDNSLLFVTNVLLSRMKVKGYCLVPFHTIEEGFTSDLDVYNLQVGDSVQFDHDVRIHMSTVHDENETEYFTFFTNEEEIRKQDCGNVIMTLPIADILEIGLKSEKTECVIVNPFGLYFKLNKPLLKMILKEYHENWETKGEHEDGKNN